MFIRITIFTMAAVIVAGSAGLAESLTPCVEYEALLRPIGYVPSRTRNLHVVGDLAYTCGSGVDIVDVSDPSEPEVISTFWPGGNPVDLHSDGDFLWLVNGNDLRGCNVSNPYQPQLSWVVEASADPVVLDVVGDRAYIACNNPTLLEVRDLSTHDEPALLGTVAITEFAGFRALDVHEGFAYLLGNSGLHIVDVRDAAAPAWVSTNHVTSGRDIEVHGGLAYVGTGGSLDIIDVSDPLNPVLVAEGVGSVGIAVTVAGTRAYMAGGPDYDFQVIDVSDPTEPVVLGSINAPIPLSGYREIQLAGDVAWVSGLVGFDVANPNAPTAISSIGGFTVRDLAFWGDHAYVAGPFRQVAILDVSDPSAPLHIADIELPLGSSRARICADDGLLYVLQYDQGLTIMSLANPLLPNTLGFYKLRGGRAVVAHDGYAYISSSRLEVVDVRDPARPSLVKSVPLRDFLSEDLQMVDDRLYVLNRWGLEVIDPDPLSPGMEIASVGNIGYCKGFDFAGDLICLATGEGLRFIDNSDPYHPFLLPDPEGGVAFDADVIVHESIAYVGRDWHGMTVMDISDPSQPRYVANCPIPNATTITGIDIHNDLVFLSDPSRGIHIYAMQCESTTDAVVATDSPLTGSRGVVSVAPNPFNPHTRIRFTSTKAQDVDVVVYDARGRAVRTLRQGQPVDPGVHEFDWDGRDDRGRALATGVYLCRISGDNSAVSVKLMLAR